jgi:hypothetical protein
MYIYMQTTYMQTTDALKIVPCLIHNYICS